MRDSVIHKVALGLAAPQAIDERLHFFKVHKPYHESDHVLNIAYNPCCGARPSTTSAALDRNFLDALGAAASPTRPRPGLFRLYGSHGPRTYGGDQLRRVTRFGASRELPFSTLPQSTSMSTTVGTLARQGGDGHRDNGTWGYHPLVVSLANTGEPLYIYNRSGNRPSHAGAPAFIDKAISLCKRAGFKKILVRGDTDFSLTTNFDRWDEKGVTFVFGYDAKPKW